MFMIEITNKIKELYGNKNYQEVINVFENELTKEEDLNYYWSLFYYLQSSTNSNHFKTEQKELLNLLESDEYLLLDDNIKDALKSVVMRYISKDNIRRFNIINVKDSIETLKNIYEGHQEFDKYLYEILKFVKPRDNVFNMTVLEMLKINENLYSLTPNQYQDNTYQSNKELYYRTYVSFLLAIEDYQEVVSVVNKALNEIKEFHHNNDKHLLLEQAEAYFHLNEVDKSFKIYEKILLTLKEWWLYAKYAEKLVLNKDFDQGLINYSKAILLFGKDDFKVNVYNNLGYVLEHFGYNELADNAFKIAFEERAKQMFKIDKDLKSKYKEDANGNIREFKKEILDILYDKERVYPGEVDNLLRSGRDGFIKHEYGRVYFRINDYIGNRRDIKSGFNVSYILEKTDRGNRAIFITKRYDA